MSEEMNKEAEVQEEAVDIPVTDGSEEEADLLQSDPSNSPPGIPGRCALPPLPVPDR